MIPRISDDRARDERRCCCPLGGCLNVDDVVRRSSLWCCWSPRDVRSSSFIRLPRSRWKEELDDHEGSFDGRDLDADAENELLLYRSRERPRLSRRESAADSGCSASLALCLENYNCSLKKYRTRNSDFLNIKNHKSSTADTDLL